MIAPQKPHHKALLQLVRLWHNHGYALKDHKIKGGVVVLGRHGKPVRQIVPDPEDNQRFWHAWRSGDRRQLRKRALKLLVNDRMAEPHWAHLWLAEDALDRERATDLFAIKAVASGIPADPKTGPDFVIIGTMKGGTSSLYSYICQHPRVQTRMPKELHVFTQRGDLSADGYRKLFACRAAGKLIGEASPSYFDVSQPEMPDRIMTFAPNAKLLLILAHPTRRAVSEYYHNLRISKGAAPLDAFVSEGEELTRDKVRAAVMARDSFIVTGFYDDRLDQWEALRANGSLMILTQRALKEDLDGTMDRVWAHLGLPPFQLPPRDQKIVNQNQYPKPSSDVLAELDEIYAGTVRRMQADYNLIL